MVFRGRRLEKVRRRSRAGRGWFSRVSSFASAISYDHLANEFSVFVGVQETAWQAGVASAESTFFNPVRQTHVVYKYDLTKMQQVGDCNGDGEAPVRQAEMMIIGRAKLQVNTLSGYVRKIKREVVHLPAYDEALGHDAPQQIGTRVVPDPEDVELQRALAESLKGANGGSAKPGAVDDDDVPMLHDDTHRMKPEAEKPQEELDDELAQAMHMFDLMKELKDLLGQQTKSVVKRHRGAGVDAVQRLECSTGDTLRVQDDRTTVEAAFADSDARFASAMASYLGSSGVVIKVDDESIKLQHEDGQQFWWAYGAVSMLKTGDKIVRPAPQWEKVFLRYSKFWRRIAVMAALNTGPHDIMLHVELDFFHKSVINSLSEAGWKIEKPIQRIVLQGVRDVEVAQLSCYVLIPAPLYLPTSLAWGSVR